MARKSDVIRKPVRKPPKPRAVKTRNSLTMTEAAFFSWIRSQLRRMSQKWKPIYECKKEGRREATAAEKRMHGPQTRYVNTCEKCLQWFPNKMLEVDHTIPCGSMGSNAEDFAKRAGPWILRLLVERHGLRRLCTACHLGVTHETAAS